MSYEIGKDCHLLHSFIGYYTDEFFRVMGERDPDHEKFMTFYHSEDDVSELEKRLGLDVREIICCVSKPDPAVVYHRPYGLILSGKIKAMFDNDSATSMLPDGTYNGLRPADFTNETDLQTLMTTWYDKFEEARAFTWNEAILRKGSKIVGAFHDPAFDPGRMQFAGMCTYKEQEYLKFLEKIDRLGLNLLEINAKFK